jgi:DNA polymerase-4
MARKILHLDLDAFFCAVEELHRPELRNQPFAVGGRPDGRGVVASCSYPARRYGVRSAMPMAQAVRICRDLIVVPADHSRYRAMSRQVMTRLARRTPLVEQISIDEAFLDVTERPESPESIARCIQSQIREDLDLPCSLGCASNKLVAKIANNGGKAGATGDGPPNAVTVVDLGHEAAFLAPLACSELWGVGPKTAARLEAMGIRTIGELAQRPAGELAALFGEHGRQLAERAHGVDERPVVTEHEPKSVSQETTFARDLADRDLLLKTLEGLAQGVARDLKRKQVVGATVKVKLRWSDFSTPTRQMTLSQPTDDGQRIFAAARQLFDQLWSPPAPIRLLGVGVSGLGAPVGQLGLWDQPDERVERLSGTVARLRAKFGENAILPASEMEERKRSDMADAPPQDGPQPTPQRIPKGTPKRAT